MGLICILIILPDYYYLVLLQIPFKKMENHNQWSNTKIKIKEKQVSNKSYLVSIYIQYLARILI